MPYIVEVMKGQDFTLVPIMVGAVSSTSEALYGKVLAPYLDDPSNLFVVSSDFCHWGSRFSYTYYEKTAVRRRTLLFIFLLRKQQSSLYLLLILSIQGPIHQSIERLDKQGMDLIEDGDPLEFKKYLDEYGNTICGRHPISTFLHALQHCQTRHSIKFTKYDQSHKCLTSRDSSVSYAAAVISIAEDEDGVVA